MPPPASDVPLLAPEPGGPPGKPSGLATASMVLSILGLLTSCVGVGLVLALAGLVMGIVALSTAGQTRPPRPKGRAITGVAVGAATFVLIGPMAVMMSLLLPALSAARQTAHMVRDASSLKMIGMNAELYAMDHNGVDPPHVSMAFTHQGASDLSAFNRSEDKNKPAPSFNAPPNYTPPDAYRFGDYVFVTWPPPRSSVFDRVTAFSAEPYRTGKRHVLFADGHVETLDGQAFARVIRDMNAGRQSLNLPEVDPDPFAEGPSP